MKVYKLLQAEGFELCHPEDWEAFNKAIADRHPSENWKPFRVRVVHADQGETLRASDTPWWGGHVLILRPKAVELVGPYLREHGELVKLECDEDALVAFKASRIVDALSKDSEVERLSDGSLLMIYKHVFEEDALRNVEIFTIPDFDVSPIYVTDVFVKKWRAAGLTGLTFDEVWATTLAHN